MVTAVIQKVQQPKCILQMYQNISHFLAPLKPNICQTKSQRLNSGNNNIIVMACTILKWTSY